MVFSSVPVYLDPPNWNQQPSHQPGNGGTVSGGGEAQHHQLPPGVPEGGGSGGGMGVGSVRPGSMADRARLAKVPQPEPALKCPRCESTNTKFCYFNNYSLSQPRHFCKTCRRYWTRGGALRNVPVGGGCRRNKRSKSSSGWKSSSANAADRQAGTTASGSTTTSGGGGGAIHNNMPPPQTQLPFMASFHHHHHPLADYGGASTAGLNFGAIQHMDGVDYQVPSTHSVGLEHWRLQQVHQFPFLAGLEPPLPPPPLTVGLYPFDGEGTAADGGAGAYGKPSASGLITQLASVKMEENPRGLSLPRQYLGVPGNDQYWGGGGGGGGGGSGVNSSGGGWTDLSCFSSPSTGHLL